jgi:rubrerythrin
MQDVGDGVVEEVGMGPFINYAELDLRGAFDLAILIEEDAQLRYEELSRKLGNDPGGAGDVCRMMARNEARHRSQLLARRRTLFTKEPTRIDITVIDEWAETPGTDDDLPSTAREALEMALEAERRAHAFYKEAIPHLDDPEVRAFFQELMDEEAEHQELLSRKLAELDAHGKPRF